MSDVGLGPVATAIWLAGATTILAIIAGIVAYRRGRQLREVSVRLDRLGRDIASAENAGEARNRFIAATTHDLRQPLHALGLYLAALSRHVDDTASTRILASAQRSAETLNQLLTGLLDLSRLEAGVAELDERAFSLKLVTDEIRESFDPLASERGLTLSTRVDDVWVFTDRALFERMLRNLVGNALNYTRQGGVRLTSQVDGDRVCVGIEDTGPGIPADERERVFDAHRRLDGHDDVEGVGLGLSIVRRIATLLNIGLSLDSETGCGSTFELVLPLAVPSGKTLAHRFEAGTERRLHGRAILVIDDDLQILDGMRALCDSAAVDVVLARSSREAIDQLIRRELVPDLILADLRLRDGERAETAIERVRDELNEDVPAAILTGETAADTRDRLTASGLPVLQKPVDVPVLFDFIEGHMEGQPT